MCKVISWVKFLEFNIWKATPSHVCNKRFVGIIWKFNPNKTNRQFLCCNRHVFLASLRQIIENRRVSHIVIRFVASVGNINCGDISCVSIHHGSKGFVFTSLNNSVSKEPRLLFMIYNKITSFSNITENEAISFAQFYLQQSGLWHSSSSQQGAGGIGKGHGSLEVWQKSSQLTNTSNLE